MVVACVQAVAHLVAHMFIMHLCNFGSYIRCRSVEIKNAKTIALLHHQGV